MSLSKKFYKCSAPPNPLLKDKSPRDVSSLARRARDEGNLNLSFSLLKDGIKLHPNDPYLWRDMGFTLLEANEFKESLSFFKRAYVLAPDDMKIGMPYARRLRCECMYEEAEQLYMKYIPGADNTDSMKLLESLGILYFQKKEKGLAAACLGQAILHGLQNSHAIEKYAALNAQSFTLNDETWAAFANRLQAVLAPQKPVQSHTASYRPKPA